MMNEREAQLAQQLLQISTELAGSRSVMARRAGERTAADRVERLPRTIQKARPSNSEPVRELDDPLAERPAEARFRVHK